jgi:pSer/pThr/pTyr-binding forkhead associated (FHA) protein/tetratricopeptide (TPR) repeat protein
MAAAALLTIVKDGETIKAFSLEGEADIGRGEGCVIRLDDRAISRQHAVFRKTGDRIQVERKSEFAPLSVNGEEKTSALLKEGDVIAIGPYLVKLTLSRAASVSAPVAAPAPVAVAEVIPLPVLADVEQEPIFSGAGAMGLEDAPGDANVLAFDPPEQPIGLDAVSPALESFEPVPVSGTLLELNGLPSSDMGSGVVEMSSVSSLESNPTMVGAAAFRLETALIFEPGQANVTEYRITKDEVSIGRGKDCDIILNDKRSSRKNAVIIRKGSRYTICDKESANGTYVNDRRIEELELSGGDRILIGDTEFVFKAIQSGFSEMQGKFMPLPALAENAVEEMPVYSVAGETTGPDMISDPQQNSAPDAAMNHIPGISTGPAPSASGKRKTIIDKYRELPPKKKLIYTVLIIAFLWCFLDDDEATNPVKQATKGQRPKTALVEGMSGPTGAAMSKDALAAFAALTPDQKKFVERQHDLAFSLFQRKEYDRAIDEITKIFSLVVDYKDSREIERYAREGKRRMDAALEERRKKEEEEALKRKIALLVNEAGDKMHAKKFDAARDLFSQILALDPENKAVGGWQHELQEQDEERRIEAQKKMVQQEVNRQAWELYKKGVALRKEGASRAAIQVFGNVGKIDSIDRRPAGLAKRGIASIEEEIRQVLAPLMADAKQADDAQDYVKAMQGYEAALKIEPDSKEAGAAIDRIRGILHERAKVLFTEAIIAESYSDFSGARKKFQDCRQMAPTDDIYRARCERKLARYFKIDGEDSRTPGGP